VNLPRHFLCLIPDERWLPVAQRVQVLLEDDLDGGEAAETVSFALDGVSYEIDLSTKNANKLRDAMAPYIGSARRVGGRRRRGGARASSGRSTSSADIREWARNNGWDIPDRGRIAAEVREAYAAAH
jgi:Lsr2